MQVKERSRVRDEGEMDSCTRSSMGLSQVQAQAPKVETACSKGKVRARKVGVDADLHDLGMVRGIEVVAGKDGKGKVVVEEKCSFSDVGERLSGEGSKPKGY